jgi:hypothetical protein
MYPHLQAILPDLKLHFERAYICPPPSTLQQRAHMEDLEADPFFTIFRRETEMQIGERFGYLYGKAAEAAPAEQILHLAYVDRLAFALETAYHDSFLADIDGLMAQDMPLIFQRSERAWQSHPGNYRDIEGFVTTAGWHLFGRELDHAWCHMAATAGQLRKVMPLVKNPDLSMVAEMIYYLQKDIHTRNVDWLAWEDPFMLGRDAEDLKAEREAAPAETHKRLTYVARMLDLLKRLAGEERQQVV